MAAVRGPRREALQRVEHQKTSHPGLWLDKFLSSEADGSKARVIQEMTDTSVPEGYTEAVRLRKAQFEKLVDHGRALRYTARTEGRLVLGLGAKGVVEAGLRLDHTWGVPVLPGSSLKGLAAAAAHLLAEDESWRKRDPRGGDPNSHETLFGTTDDAGKVIFHDAWWLPEEKKGEVVPIHADVMTVHHPGYYQGSGDHIAPPSDFDSPNPVPFASVTGSFLVVIEGPPDWCKAAADLLEAGLRELGLGAKTNSGYGRLILVRWPTEAEGERARLAEQFAVMPKKESLAVEATRWMKKFADAASRGVEEATLADAAERLFRIEEKFWRAWVNDERRSDIDRQTYARWMHPVDARLSKSAATRLAEPVVEPPPAHVEHEAVAWIEPDKQNRPTLFVLVSGSKRAIEEEVRKLGDGLPERERRELNGKRAAPVAVSVLLKGNRRVLRVRIRV